MDLTSFGAEDNKKPKEINDSKLDLDFNKIKKDFSIKEVERFLPWFLKYQLNKFEDLIETSETKKIIKFIEEFKP